MDVLCAGFLPGCLAGTHIAGLLFFLNPELPFDRWSLARVIGAYALPLGAVTLLVQLPFFWRNPEKARRALPWGLTAALAFTGILDFTQASHFAHYLQPGIKIRLLKAGSLLSLAALIAFYTALLHSLQRRRYGTRSIVGFTFLVLASVYVMVERREAFRPVPERIRSSALRTDLSRPQLMVVGIEAATLDVILPLAQEERLPFFAMLLREGASGRLESITPYRRAALWTSVATGKSPYRHGIADEEMLRTWMLGAGRPLRLLPAGIGFRSWGVLGGEAQPVQRRDRRALGIWQILSRLGYSSGVVGWPCTAPVASELSFSLSEAFFEGPERPGNAQPPATEARAELFRVGVGEVDPLILARFGEIVPYPIQQALAGDIWRQTIKAYLLDHQQPLQGTFLFLPGLELVSRRYFGGYAAVALGEPGEVHDQQAYEWVATYYELLDAYLQELWRRHGGQDSILAVVSAAGMRQRPGWRTALELPWKDETLEGSFAGSPDGVLFLYGQGVRPGARLTGARITDLTPSLLYALRYPLARDMDGRVLTQAFDQAFLARHPLTFVPSYEALPPSGLQSAGLSGP